MENVMQKTNLEVAHTILAQINAFDFWARARWGYNSPTANSNSLTFKVRGVKVGYAYVKISLTSMDDYTVEVFRVRRGKLGIKRTELAKIEGVFCDNLVPVIDAAIDGRN